ncbi:MAG: PQQ-binding-like beta-propeller repeat protein [Pirellulales bacterium]
MHHLRFPAVIAIVALWTAPPAHAENWPQFRGPTGQGISAEKNLPTRWSATENVAWNTPVPGDGWSSPIVFGDRVFLTATTAGGSKCHVIALDRKSGKILWNKEVLTQETRRKEQKNSYATPTPVTDGKLLFAVFGGGGIVAVDYEGNVAWTYDKVKFYSRHGLGASPVLYENLLIMPFDGSNPPPDEKIGWKIPWEEARILALDKQRGTVVWQGKRGPSRIAHTTPLVVRQPQPRLYSTAGDVIQAFDLRDGRRIWTAYSQGEGVVPSPLLVDNLLVTCSGFEKPTIRAVRLGGEEDVTSTHIAWEQTKGVPSQSSLVYVEPHLYAVTDQGVVSIFEVSESNAKLIGQGRAPGNYSASPVTADGKIYLLSEQGNATVIEAGPEFKVIATNAIGERCQASPAVSQGQIFIRTDKNLYCVGE